MMPASELIRPVTDLLFPPRCPLCGGAIADQTGLCASCWSELVIPGEPSCPSCARPFVDPPLAGSPCAPCAKTPPRHDGIAAATLYNDALRRLVLNFKHGNAIALARLMAPLMAAKIGRLSADTLLVPVPLHRWRLWRRGYNQSALLARELARLTGASLAVDLLRRVKATPPLGRLNGEARRETLQGAIAFQSRRADLCRGRDVILIDDVLTSGATSDACVDQLRQAGAKAVKIACFARVLSEGIPVSDR